MSKIQKKEPDFQDLYNKVMDEGKNEWVKYVQDYKQNNPDKSMKECLIDCKDKILTEGKKQSPSMISFALLMTIITSN